MRTRRALVARIGGMTLIWVGLATLAAVMVAGPTASERVHAPMRLVAEETANPQPGTFGVSGTKHGFFPGGSSQMPLVLTNPNAFAIEVEQVHTNAASDTVGCPADNVSFGALAQRTIVEANSSKTTEIPVAMALAASDACQGATFTLTFSGTAGPAPGVVVPDDAPGTGGGSGSGGGSGAAGTEVLGSTQQRPNPLARTGVARTAVLVLGLACVGAGALLSAVTRRAR